MGLSEPSALVAMKLEQRNRLAQALIDDYSTRHGLMDIGVGLAGLIPGAAIPALMTAIAAQAPVIYQPLARKLARIYLASPDELGCAESNIVAVGVVQGGILDIVAEFFGADFIAHIAGEMLFELGFGAALTLIPIFGAIAGAGLDWVIATKMTKRVGLMTAMYFQNGAAWVDDKETTYKMAKAASDIHSVRKLPPIKASLVNSVRTMVAMMRTAMSDFQIRQALRTQDIPDDLIDDALAT